MDIKFMVCPHDTASNPDKWFHLAQYISRHLTESVHFHKCLDFGEFHEQLTEGGLIYANPQDSLHLIKEHNYEPLVRATNLSDEIVFIASEKIDTPQLSDFNNSQVVSVNSMMVTRVGVKYLFDNQITPDKITSKDNWMSVVKGIYRSEDDYAMLYKDFYEGLNSLTKSGLQFIDKTQDGTIHHNLLIAPEFASLSQEVQQLLLKMGDDGQKILADLDVEKFVSVSKEDILKFEMLSGIGNEIMVLT